MLRAIIATPEPSFDVIAESDAEMTTFTHGELLAHIRRLEAQLPRDVVDASWEEFAK
jgi:hypothetical protein